jgi:hypothetical protein
VYDINSLGELHGINIEAEGQLSFMFGTNSICNQRPKAGYET